MGVTWILANWLDLLQSLGIISGFVFTAHSIRRDAEARKISNLLAITERHHAIWKPIYERPELARILEQRPGLDEKPLTREEQRFVTSIIIHLDSVHRAIKAKMFVKLEGLRRDIKEFFSLPIPNRVWQELKQFHDADFVAFVERALD